MPFLTVEQIAERLQTFIKSVFPTAQTGGGTAATVFNDVVINGPGSQSSDLFGEDQYTRLTSTFTGFLTAITNANVRQQLKDLFNFTTDEELDAKLTVDLDNKARDVKQFRNPGNFAGTPMTYVFGSGALVTVPGGHQDRTRGINPVVFEVSQTITLQPQQQASGAFTLPVPVQATQVGIIGNTGSGTILDFDGGVTGLLSVVNEADVTNGLEPESNEVFTERLIDIERKGFALDTADGLRQFFLAAGVPDVAVVTAQDPNSTRFFGVDAWVLLDEPLVALDQLQWALAFTTDGYIPINQPLNPDELGIALSGFPNAEFLVIPMDLTNGDAASIVSQDRIQITFPTGAVPTVGDQLGLTYIYNGGIRRVQQEISDPNLELFAEIFVKQATKRTSQITLPYNIEDGFNPADVTQEVQQTIIALVSDLLLGESLSLSDVIDVVADVPGVLRILVEEMVFNFTDNPETDDDGNVVPRVDVLEVEFNQYIRLDSGGLIVSPVT